ncbi:hypothetical protein EG329_009715 [Mollisiaceae sp. DMI_Dod_QoI]|nr:hypothetical protein EG329_009715 [Helotiales sp. DMI_Dod_QoI]
MSVVRAGLPTPLNTSILDVSWRDGLVRSIDELGLKSNNISLDEKDAVLLQHYITHTAATIATDPATLKLWQKAVPHLAHSHPFLLHGLLALSALHLAHTTPSDSALHSQYLLSAITHQETAMPIFRSSIAAVTPETSHAVFIFSHLLVLYCFASESQDERLLILSPTPDLLPIWLQFLRAGCRLLCHVWGDLEAGPVKALASAWDIPELELDGGRTPFVEDLLSHIPLSKTEDAWSEDENKVYTDTAILLGRAFTNRALDIAFTTWDALRIWPMCISKEYMEMLRNQHPGALILLAHYCVLLKNIEGNWYFDGRATGLLRSVLGCLDQKWMKAVKWPIEKIGITVII